MTLKTVLKALTYEMWLPVLIVVALWVGSARSENLFFPPLNVIANTFAQMWLFDRLGTDAWPSVRNVLIGLALATMVGVLAGLLFGLVEGLYQAALPVLEFMRAVPGIVLVPVGLALLGIGDSMKIGVIAYGTLWPIMLHTIDGVRSIDLVVTDMAKSFHVKRFQLLWRVVLPSASPQILAGARISVSMGIVLIIASEYVASTRGIGFLQLQAERTFAIPEMWAALVLLGIIGYASNVIFRIVENRVLRWYIGLRNSGKEGITA